MAVSDLDTATGQTNRANHSAAHSTLIYRLLVSLSRLGARIFKNTTGQYRLARPDCRRCQETGRVMRSGLCVGGSDLVGWLPVVITDAHVGQTLAVFVAIEAKTGTGRPTTEQVQFMKVVKDHGGIVCLARSEQDAETTLAPWLV